MKVQCVNDDYQTFRVPDWVYREPPIDWFIKVGEIYTVKDQYRMRRRSKSGVIYDTPVIYLLKDGKRNTTGFDILTKADFELGFHSERFKILAPH